VVPIADRHNDAAQALGDRLSAAGVRVEVDLSDGTMQNKVRNAEMQKTPYVLVLGDKEIEGGTLAVRKRGAGRPQFGVPAEEFIAGLLSEIETRAH